MVLSDADIERFVADGFVVLRQGFACEVAAEGRAFISKLLGLPNDGATGAAQPDYDAIAARLGGQGIPAQTYNQPIVHVQQGFTDEPFGRVMNPRLQSALDEVSAAAFPRLRGRFLPSCV